MFKFALSLPMFSSKAKNLLFHASCAYQGKPTGPSLNTNRLIFIGVNAAVPIYPMAKKNHHPKHFWPFDSSKYEFQFSTLIRIKIANGLMNDKVISLPGLAVFKWEAYPKSHQKQCRTI